MAALYAVELCHDLGIYDIILEGDSLVVVKAIKEASSSWVVFGQIMDNIQLVLQSLRSWNIGHVKREANSVARTLAKEATKTTLD